MGIKVSEKRKRLKMFYFHFLTVFQGSAQTPGSISAMQSGIHSILDGISPNQLFEIMVQLKVRFCVFFVCFLISFIVSAVFDLF